MAVRWNTKKNRFPEMERAAAELNGKRVEVGVAGEHAWLAGIHEYGCKIKVTDKMRAYLHGQGLHLRKSTEFITIPERAFLRSGYDQGKDGVIQDAEGILADVLTGDVNSNTFLESLGLLLSSSIKDYATALDGPPNHPFTLNRKGSSNPLVNTGDMIGSISHKVV